MAEVPSSRVGMGATPYGGGTTFRVWAPNALGAAVTGDFTSWSAAGVPLASEPGGTGMWSADVAGCPARPGLPDPAHGQRRHAHQGGPVRPAGGQRERPRHQGGHLRRDRLRLGRGELYLAGLDRPGHLRAACRQFQQAPRPAGWHPGRRGREAALPRELGVSAVELLPVASFEGCDLVGIRPGRAVLGRASLWRPGRPEGVRPRRPRAGHRGDPRRGLQPLRPGRLDPLAVRRERPHLGGRDLLLRCALPGRPPPADAVGVPARLRAPRGAPVPGGQRHRLAAGLPARRAAPGCDGLHPQRLRRRGSGLGHSRGLAVASADQ